MESDGKILRKLLHEDCCCDECCPEKVSAAAAREAARAQPAHPQMLAKRMLPLDVPPEDGPFVPPSFPSRETPQRPEPKYRPSMDASTLYDGTNSGAQNGYSTGVLLDSGELSILPSKLGSIDHQTRQARSKVANVNKQNPLIDAGAGFAAFDMAQATIDTLQPPTGLGNVVTDSRDYTINGGALLELYPDLAAFEERIGSLSLHVPGTGEVLRGQTTYARGAAQTVTTQTNFFAQEEPGTTFEGVQLNYPTSSLTLTQTAAGVQLQYRIGYRVNTSQGARTTDVNGNRYYPFTVTDVYRSVPSDQLEYTTSFNYPASLGGWVVLPGTINVHFEALVNGSIVSRDLVYVGVLITIGVTGTYVGQSGAPVIGHEIINGTDYAWFKSRGAVGVVYAAAPEPVPGEFRPAPDDLLFLSPVANGTSFSVRLRFPAHLGASTEFYDLSQYDLYVGGDKVPGSLRSWTAFRTATGITLVAADATNVYVIPDLDLTKMVTVTHAQLLADFRQTPDVSLSGLNSHTGHHSYPQDRGYAYTATATVPRWLSFGPWDAYRDVTAKEWLALGLSKPRTRAAFEKGKLLTPPAPTPPRPLHGLAIWDRFNNSDIIES